MEDGATQMGPKVAIGISIHDLMDKHQSGGVGRHYLWRISLEICHQICIYYQNLGGTVRFEFKTSYKLHMLVHQRTLCSLRDVWAFFYLKLMNHQF